MEGTNMAKEYLVVLFPRKRRVKIGSEAIGVTNTKLKLEGGPYKVTLGPPKNWLSPPLTVALIF